MGGYFHWLFTHIITLVREKDHGCVLGGCIYAVQSASDVTWVYVHIFFHAA